MGYNFFKIVEVPKNFNRRLNDFRASLSAAISEGKDITFADNDITYALKLQYDRLCEKDSNWITMSIPETKMIGMGNSSPAVTGRMHIIRALYASVVSALSERCIRTEKSATAMI